MILIIFNYSISSKISVEQNLLAPSPDILLIFTIISGMWWWNSLMYLLWKAGLFPTTAGEDGFIFTDTYGMCQI